MNDEYVKSIGTGAPSRKKCTPPDKTILNESQQIVLDWLKKGNNSPFALVSELDDDFLGIETMHFIPDSVREAFEKLKDIEQFQVLAAFAEWGKGRGGRMKVTAENWGKSKRELQDACDHCGGSSKIYEQVNNLTFDQVYNTIRVMNYPANEEPTCAYIRMKYCPMCGRKLKPVFEL